VIPFANGGVNLHIDSLGSAAFAMVVCLLLSFFFSGTETALFSLQKIDRKRFARGSRTERQAARLLHQQRSLLTTILIGNETVNIALATVGTTVLAALTPNSPWLNVLFVTPVLVLFSEITPKVLAFRFPAVWSRAATWPLTAFFVAVSPIRYVVSGIVRSGARLFKVVEAAEDERLQEDEILDMIEESAAHGDVDRREHEIVEAVFEFDDLTVARVMTARPDIFSVPLTTSWDRLLKDCRDAGFSRAPVYRTRTDDIIGVLLIRDLLSYRSAPTNVARELHSLLLPPVFVPGSKRADVMLKEFLDKKFHMAFVVNEHGTLVGLVTLDDLLAELLDHETDEDDEIEEIRPGTLAVKAWMDVDDFAEESGIALPSGDYNTIGGYVFHALGRLPRVGDTVTLGTARFVVGSMDGRRIAEVRVRTDRTEESE